MGGTDEPEIGCSWQTETTRHFNELELAVFRWLDTHYAQPRLAAQLENAKLIGREWTGVGFFVHLKVPRQLPPLILDDFGGHWPIDGPELMSEDIDGGGSAIIWGTDGYIDCLEMYAYGAFFNETVSAFNVVSRPCDQADLCF